MAHHHNVSTIKYLYVKFSSQLTFSHPRLYHFQPTSYETQRSLVRKIRTDMDMDHNRQQYDTAMMGDVNQQSPQPSFSSFPANSMLGHTATMRTAHGIAESGLPAAYHLTSMYKVKNGHTLTCMSNPEPQPFFSGVFMNNMQPLCRCPFCGGPLDTILRPL
ncbi:hypothetical protein M378DRAFT_181061 [Amanita muscaria Koide BX008]|uniref:Uncharacterized protein n=1 Tax=Amanita muscaria (strain Koide BX008) TaxID=946122 RepID=A0A0C2S7V8_AMAMK|nr:hypothetical protein M378DRAFT_181061 [Amanita muscaria Koide BX008]